MDSGIYCKTAPIGPINYAFILALILLYDQTVHLGEAVLASCSF